MLLGRCTHPSSWLVFTLPPAPLLPRSGRVPGGLARLASSPRAGRAPAETAEIAGCRVEDPIPGACEVRAVGVPGVGGGKKEDRGECLGKLCRRNNRAPLAPPAPADPGMPHRISVPLGESLRLYTCVHNCAKPTLPPLAALPGIVNALLWWFLASLLLGFLNSIFFFFF